MSRWDGKYVIGLTGNIAMGKSLVRRMLDHLGAYTIDADGLAHQAMAPGAPAYKPVVQTFGQWILDGERRIDRSRLGAVAFSHPEALGRLEKLTHPIVGSAIDTLIKRSRHKVVVVEAIKLFEGTLADQVDAIWVVDTTEQTQLTRLIKRGLSAEEAIKRIRLQNPQADKVARASVVIDNDGTPEETWKQVRAAWIQIKGAAEEEAAQSQIQRVNVAPSQQVAPATSAGAASPALTAFDIVRGMPRNADVIAAIIGAKTGQPPTRGEVLARFGEKSYILAINDSEPLGLIGFLVENLVTRVDELMIMDNALVRPVAAGLLEAVERASRELQSEVGYVFIPENVSADLAQTFSEQGYVPTEIADIRVPAWREAVRESRPEGASIYSKKLRAERVLKPL